MLSLFVEMGRNRMFLRYIPRITWIFALKYQPTYKYSVQSMKTVYSNSSPINVHRIPSIPTFVTFQLYQLSHLHHPRQHFYTLQQTCNSGLDPTFPSIHHRFIDPAFVLEIMYRHNVNTNSFISKVNLLFSPL